MKKLFVLFLAVLLLASCAPPQNNQEKGTRVGALGGAAAGALLGQAIGGNTKGTLIGAGVMTITLEPGAGVDLLAGLSVGTLAAVALLGVFSTAIAAVALETL